MKEKYLTDLTTLNADQLNEAGSNIEITQLELKLNIVINEEETLVNAINANNMIWARKFIASEDIDDRFITKNNYKISNYRTIFDWACQAKNQDIMDALLNKELLYLYPFIETLESAISKHDLIFLEFFLKSPSIHKFVESRHMSTDSLLIKAVNFNKKDIISLLLNSKLKFKPHSYKYTYISACANQDFELLNLICQHNLSSELYLNSSTEELEDFFKIAIKEKQISILKYLIKNKDNSGLAPKINFPFIWMACEKDDLELLELSLPIYLNNGEQLNISSLPENEKEHFPRFLHKAIMNKNIPMIEKLLEVGGSDINLFYPWKGHGHPLISAILTNDLSIVQFLCERGAHVPFDKTPHRDYCPVTNAIIMLNLDVLKFLYPKYKNLLKKGHALEVAIEVNSLEIVKYLHEQGESLEQTFENETSENGFTPLMKAVKNNKLEIVEYFLSKEENINQENEDGQTAFHYVKTVEMLDCLLSHGADINLKGNKGRTLLMQLVEHGNNSNFVKLVERVLEKNADIQIKDTNGRDVYDILCQEGKRTAFAVKISHTLFLYRVARGLLNDGEKAMMQRFSSSSSEHIIVLSSKNEEKSSDTIGSLGNHTQSLLPSPVKNNNSESSNNTKFYVS